VKIVWSRRATHETEQAMDRIGRDVPEAALTWFDGLNVAVERLEQFPFSGRVIPELPLSDRREIQYRGYRVIYRVKPDEVHVLRVVHGRRDMTPRDRELILDTD
jgi:plasmid stabilization system protein ParE